MKNLAEGVWAKHRSLFASGCRLKVRADAVSEEIQSAHLAEALSYRPKIIVG